MFGNSKKKMCDECYKVYRQNKKNELKRLKRKENGVMSFQS